MRPACRRCSSTAARRSPASCGCRSSRYRPAASRISARCLPAGWVEEGHVPRFLPKQQIPQPVQPVVRPQPVNAPRMVDFTGGMGNLSLDALQQRQQDYATQAAQGMPEIRHPTQGIAYLLNQFNARAGENMAAEAEAQNRSRLAELMTRMEPGTNNIHPNALGDIMSIDLETGLALWKEQRDRAAAAREQEHWTLIPTPEGETGQWYKNDVNGEVKKVGGGAGNQGDNLMTVLKDYNQQGPVKDYPIIKNALERIKFGATTGDPPGDMALIFGYMKLLDPTSTVREGEYATVQNSGGVADWVLNLYNKAVDGQILQPHQRAAFVAQAQGQYGVWTDSLKQVNDRYTKIAQMQGVDPALILIQPQGFDDDTNKPPDEPPDSEYPEGTKVEVQPDGSKLVTLPDGTQFTELPGD